MSAYDPFAIFRNMWESMGVSLPPTMAVPTSIDELQSRLKELKSVEGWLRTNLGVLQITIQTMEMQYATLTALRSAAAAAPTGKDEAPSAEPAQTGEQTPEENPFAKFFSNPATNPALWAWVNPDITVPPSVADSFKGSPTSAAAETPAPAKPAKPSTKTTAAKGDATASPRSKTRKPRS